jgi:carboxyl-terminal processing protease
MRSRLVAMAAALLMLAAGFGAGAFADRTHLLPGSDYVEPQSVSSTFSVFWQAWDLVQKNYVDRAAINPTQMTYGAVQGMLNSLGDAGHTRFLSPQDLKQENESLSGHLEGIGAEVSTRNGQPTIVAPIPGSPAQKAGIRPGDVIVKVNGQDVSQLTLDEVVNLIRGPAGTSVTLTILHQGDTILTDITVVRAQITVPNVTWSQLPGTQVAHVLVSQFGDNTTQDLGKVLQQAQAAGLKGMILDLRNDPGGLRDEAIGVASQFLTDGNVLLEQDAQGHRTPFPVKSGGVASNMPLVVLINEGTASAAEIVAGALQDHHRGSLVGATTFGTGTVLSSFALGDGSAILLGTEEWFTPNGRQIWHHGIVPDIQLSLPNGVVPLTPDEENGMTSQQLQASQDTQLLRALQEVTRTPR